MFQSEQAGQLAERLRALKVRTNRSYEVLARRVGVSSSTLHRYCSGEVVPPNCAVLVRFCKVCGATREEAEELLAYWALAVNGNDQPPPTPQPDEADVRRRWLIPVAVLAGVAGGALWRHGRSRTAVAGHLSR
ncbi:helix-turn-helix domain-containing protein [Actinophytocola sediminis]